MTYLTALIFVSMLYAGRRMRVRRARWMCGQADIYRAAYAQEIEAAAAYRAQGQHAMADTHEAWARHAQTMAAEFS